MQGERRSSGKGGGDDTGSRPARSGPSSHLWVAQQHCIAAQAAGELLHVRLGGVQLGVGGGVCRRQQEAPRREPCSGAEMEQGMRIASAAYPRRLAGWSHQGEAAREHTNSQPSLLLTAAMPARQPECQGWRAAMREQQSEQGEEASHGSGRCGDSGSAAGKWTRVN